MIKDGPKFADEGLSSRMAFGETEDFSMSLGTANISQMRRVQDNELETMSRLQAQLDQKDEEIFDLNWSNRMTFGILTGFFMALVFRNCFAYLASEEHRNLYSLIALFSPMLSVALAYSFAKLLRKNEAAKLLKQAAGKRIYQMAVKIERKICPYKSASL
jgi:hypothetical protein